MEDKKTISLALSGSGFKLPALVGALAAFVDKGYTITEIAGTSGGSIVGALFSTGMSPSVMKNLCDTTDFTKLMPWNYFTFWKGLSNSDNLLEWLLAHTGHVACGETIIPFKAIASNLSLETPFEFSTELTPDVPVALASVYSASIPIIYQARSYNNHILADGGLVNNCPVSHLNIKSSRVGIALYSSSKDMNKLSFMQYLGRVIDTMLQANEKTHLYLATVEKARIIPVNTFGIGMLDRKMSIVDRQRLYDSGYGAVINSFSKQERR